MSTILLSIKPKYIEEIFKGNKRFEYRKIKCKKEIQKIVIYSTFPEKKIVGEIEVIKILDNTPKQIWNITKHKAGISKKEFNKYYKNKTRAIAFELGKFKKYKEAINLLDFGINFSPQNFVYLD